MTASKTIFRSLSVFWRRPTWKETWRQGSWKEKWRLSCEWISKAQCLLKKTFLKCQIIYLSISEQCWLHRAETQRKVIWSEREGDLHDAGWPGKDITCWTASVYRKQKETDHPEVLCISFAWYRLTMTWPLLLPCGGWTKKRGGMCSTETSCELLVYS